MDFCKRIRKYITHIQNRKLKRNRSMRMWQTVNPVKFWRLHDKQSRYILTKQRNKNRNHESAMHGSIQGEWRNICMYHYYSCEIHAVQVFVWIDLYTINLYSSLPWASKPAKWKLHKIHLPLNVQFANERYNENYFWWIFLENGFSQIKSNTISIYCLLKISLCLCCFLNSNSINQPESSWLCLMFMNAMREIPQMKTNLIIQILRVYLSNAFCG